jgi:hypothetical protein
MHRAAVYEDSCDALFSAPQNKQGRHNLPPRFNLIRNDKKHTIFLPLYITLYLAYVQIIARSF